MRAPPDSPARPGPSGGGTRSSRGARAPWGCACDPPGPPKSARSSRRRRRARAATSPPRSRPRRRRRRVPGAGGFKRRHPAPRRTRRRRRDACARAACARAAAAAPGRRGARGAPLALAAAARTARRLLRAAAAAPRLHQPLGGASAGRPGRGGPRGRGARLPQLGPGECGGPRAPNFPAAARSARTLGGDTCAAGRPALPPAPAALSRPVARRPRRALRGRGLRARAAAGGARRPAWPLGDLRPAPVAPGGRVSVPEPPPGRRLRVCVGTARGPSGDPGAAAGRGGKPLRAGGTRGSSLSLRAPAAAPGPALCLLAAWP